METRRRLQACPTFRSHNQAMKSSYTRRLLESVASGAASGAAGTLALHMTHEASYKYAPGSLPPMYEEPGHYMVRNAASLLGARARTRVTQSAEDRAATVLSFAYGALWPSLWLARRGRRAGILDGAVLGVAVWCVGYLGWLPRLRLSPPVQQQTATQVFNNIAQHAMYGVLTVTAWRGIRTLLD